MGLSGIGPTELLVILAIVIMLFGTKRLRNLGSDLGSAMKGFKNAMQEDARDRDDDDDRAVEQVQHSDPHEHSEASRETHHSAGHS